MLESKNKLSVQNNIWGVWCGAIPSRAPAWICFSFTSTPAQLPHGFKNISLQFYRLGSGAPHSVKIRVVCIRLRMLPVQAEHRLSRIFFLIPPFRNLQRRPLHCFIYYEVNFLSPKFLFYFLKSLFHSFVELHYRMCLPYNYTSRDNSPDASQE